MLRERPGARRCGLLDFQDAVRGPASRDPVLLIEDARRDVSPALREAMTARYLDAFPAIDRAQFRRSAAILAAQRNCKIIGIFTRLARRDGKPQYLGHIPRVWRLSRVCAIPRWHRSAPGSIGICRQPALRPRRPERGERGAEIGDGARGRARQRGCGP